MKTCEFCCLPLFCRTGTRFSVRVSAVEIVGRSETVRDLLTEQASGNVSLIFTAMRN